MSKPDSVVEILLQIREDLRGVTNANRGFTQLKDNMGDTARAAKQATAAIDRDFGKLSNSISEKFSAKSIGMSLLGGLGIGSAFGVVNTVLGKITEEFESHRQKLKEIDDTWKDIIAKSEAYRFSNMSSKEQVAALEAKLAALHQQHIELLTPKEIETKIFTPGGGVITSKATTAFGSSDDLKAQAVLLREMTAAAMELEQARAKLVQENTRASEQEKAALLEVSKLYTQTWGAMEKNYTAALADMPESDFEARRAAIEDMFYAGKIGAEAASRALKDLDADQERWGKNAEEVARKHLKVWSEVFGKINDGGREQAIENNTKDAAEAAARAAEQMGWAFTSAFEEAILSGQKLGDVLRGLARDIAQIALRRAVTEPLGNAVGGFISKIFAAGGGTFMTNGPTQLTVGDNPGGAELVSVIPLSGVGTTRVSGSVAQMAGGGALLAGAGRGREITVVQNLNISTGVQGTVRAEILAMLPIFRELAQDSVREGIARGDL
jgi:hypothetical protein